MNRLSLIFLLLSGCLSNNSLDTMSMAVNNISNLSRISVGMNETEVMQIMHKPYSRETIQYQDDTFEFWFYVTRPTGLDQGRLMQQNLTPLAFKNGVLIGWGFNYYNHLVRQEKIQGNQKKIAPVQEEDVNLEKALEVPASKKGASPTPKSPTQPSSQTPAQQKPASKENSPSQKPAGKASPKQAEPKMPQPLPLELGPPQGAPKQTSHLLLGRFLTQSEDRDKYDSVQEMKSEKGDHPNKKNSDTKNKQKKKPEHPDAEDEHMIEQDNETNFDFW